MIPGLGPLACDIPEKDAAQGANETSGYAQLELVLPKREMGYGFEPIDITKEKSEFMAGRMAFMKVLFDISRELIDISKEFSEPRKVFMHITSNVRENKANGMHME